jgi:hypothetical protein
VGDPTPTYDKPLWCAQRNREGLSFPKNLLPM